jgi:hypothetical protein
MELKSKLSMFKNNKSSTSWTGHIRGSPLKWKKLDGENVVKAIKYAEKNPIRKSINSGVVKLLGVGDVFGVWWSIFAF